MGTNSPSNKKRPLWQLNKKELSIVLVLLTGLIAGLVLPQRIIIATSDSLDHRIFFKVPVDTTRIKHGDYLLFRVQQGEHTPFIRKGLTENNVLIKEVGCIPGDLLTRDADGVFFCKQNLLGKALTKDSKGNVLPVFDFNGPIPMGRFFMKGTNPRSFDSRYFGLIHDSAFLSKALPLW
ncbi:S26 family signal peptidase [Desulfopila sp. IMCC35008]|uniref:S26 family signal peptidase n=1 Tax=Desulfopila sp. IMCC35008 TaxID=2653858 RepID=UPI0013D3C836|nr:S26 family signal peptidase [Desulfopila sp. IMCC35008]